MAGSGDTFQERSKGKDVRTSNIVAAKVINCVIQNPNDAEEHWFRCALSLVDYAHDLVSKTNAFTVLGNCKCC